MPLELGDLARTEPEFVFVAPCGYSLKAAAAEAMRLLGDDTWSWLKRTSGVGLDACGSVSRPGRGWWKGSRRWLAS